MNMTRNTRKSIDSDKTVETQEQFEKSSIPEPEEDGTATSTEEKEEKAAPPPYLRNAFIRARSCAVDHHRHGKLKSVQAVVLAAGTGSRMTTLVSETHKCMLPIATIPMLYYPIHMLQRAGFTACVVIVSSGCEESVREMAKTYGLTIKLDIHSIDLSDDPGTLDSIRHIAGVLDDDVRDVMLVSSDLVSDVDVSDMFRSHRVKGAAFTMLTAQYNPKSFAPTPGQKHKSSIGPDVVMESMSECRLAMNVCGGDYDEQIKIPYSLSQHGSIVVTMDTLDAHFYILSAKLLKKYVLSPTSPCADMTSLKAEVIPHLVSMQSKTMRSREYEEASQTVAEPFASLIRYHNGSLSQGQYSQFYPRSAGGRACYTYHYDAGFCIRANTIPSFWYLNTKIPQLLSTLYPDCLLKIGDYTSSIVMPKAVVRGTTVLGRSCTLNDRTTVTDSSLGQNCVIPSGCRVTSSVLFDNVVLTPGCVIDNSMMCCTIDKEKCTIKNSIVASTLALQHNQKVSGDTLDASDLFSA
uniref:Translation initiation factor eIF2B subunit gamma n=1 Tax=Hirondellea gigas TaxID=1518452 RepID=A0A2P2I599_9CRUS